jgi:hypothetical protein
MRGAGQVSKIDIKKRIETKKTVNLQWLVLQRRERGVEMSVGIRMKRGMRRSLTESTTNSTRAQVVVKQLDTERVWARGKKRREMGSLIAWC